LREDLAAQVTAEGSQAVRITIRGDNARALGGHPPRGRCSDAARRASDDGDLALEQSGSCGTALEGHDTRGVNIRPAQGTSLS
jgi:hypothetical protein